MKKVLLCRYDYDPLDRLAGLFPLPQAPRQRFYRQNRLATDIQGDVQHTIARHGDQLLALQRRDATSSASTLLATDPQHSVLYTVGATEQRTMAYSPYGHHPTAGANQQLLGFNGECADPVTGHYLLGNGYRAFNPVLMRFNSPDSWSPFSASGMNTYTYCRNRPINSNDPSGHITVFINGKLSEFITGKLQNWLSRTRKNLLNNTIDFPRFKNNLARFNQDYFPATIKPGISRADAYSARTKIYKYTARANERRFQNEYFLADYHRTAQGTSTLLSQAAYVVKSNRLPTHTLPQELIDYVDDLLPPPQHAMFHTLKNPLYGTAGNPSAYRVERNMPETYLDYIKELRASNNANYYKYTNKANAIIASHFMLRRA